MAYFEQLTHAAKKAGPVINTIVHLCNSGSGSRIYCLFSNAIFGGALSQRELSLLRQLLLIIATRDHLRNVIGLSLPIIMQRKLNWEFQAFIVISKWLESEELSSWDFRTKVKCIKIWKRVSQERFMKQAERGRRPSGAKWICFWRGTIWLKSRLWVFYGLRPRSACSIPRLLISKK